MSEDFDLESWRLEQADRKIRKLDLNTGLPKPAIVRKNGRIKKNKYYIVDMFNPIKLIVIDHQFDRKKQAIRMIDENFKGNVIRYWICKGYLFYGFKTIVIYPATYRLGLFFSKYDMPIECNTAQERKSHRTKMRYNNRVKAGKKGRLIK